MAKCEELPSQVDLTAGKQHFLTWDTSEGCVAYRLTYRKEGSTVWSRGPVYKTNEGVLPSTFRGRYDFRPVGITPEGFETDPGPVLTVTFIEPDWQ